MAGKVRVGSGLAVLVLAAALAASVVPAPRAASADGKDSMAVSERKKLMKANRNAVKGIGKAAKAGKLDAVLASAMDLEKHAMAIPKAFEKKDLMGKTTALPKIWDEKAQFDEKAMKLAKAAQTLATAAKAGDKAEVAKLAKGMGANCGACHKVYRVKKKK